MTKKTERTGQGPEPKTSPFCLYQLILQALQLLSRLR